jgi:hypothetical protein
LVRATAPSVVAIVEVAQAIVLALRNRWRVSEHFPFPLLELRICPIWVPSRVPNGWRANVPATFRQSSLGMVCPGHQAGKPGFGKELMHGKKACLS